MSRPSVSTIAISAIAGTAIDTEAESEERRQKMSEREILRERRETVNEQEMVQAASGAARNAADKAREFAGICDEYANCLLDTQLQGRAAELRAAARERLQELRQAVADGDDLLERSKAGLDEGTIESQTETTRKLDGSVKRIANGELAGKKRDARK